MPMTPKEARAVLERCEPRLPLAEVRHWAARYESDVADDHVIDGIAPAVRARGRFLRDEFLATYHWKTHRTLRYAEKHTAAEIEDVTGVAFRQTDEKLRICLLRALDGVDWPVASALLHVGLSPEYPIIDFRALWSLGSEMPSSVSFEFWWAYVGCCRGLAATAQVSVRALDQALWAYSEAHQPSRPGSAPPPRPAKSMAEVRRAGDPHEIATLEEFREHRQTGAGVIVIADVTRLPAKAHAPSCGFVKEESFAEKVIQNRGKEGQYYFFGTLSEALRVVGARACGRCGGTG